MERKFPRHLEIMGFGQGEPYKYLDVCENVLSNQTGGTTFERVPVHLPRKGGRQNGVQKYGS